MGVRDDADGSFLSGWVLIDSGIEIENHGNHLDWVYARPPQVKAKRLDDKQGNPPHLYCYEDVFYLANDNPNGFTRLAPKEIISTDDEAAIQKRAAFHQGSSGHITLAVMGHHYFHRRFCDTPLKHMAIVGPITSGGDREADRW